MKNIPTFEAFLNESKDEIIFSVDDDKLDQILHSKFERQLDYEDIKGDSYYSLPKRDFDRFIDLADSSGFDVNYDESEKSVVYVYESTVNESFKDNRELEGNDMNSMLNAVTFLSSGIGLLALEKEMKRKFPFSIEGSPMAHPKGRGMFSTNVSFTKKGSSGLTTEEAIDAINKVLTAHGFDKHKIQILK
jgi:hypothetical protein